MQKNIAAHCVKKSSFVAEIWPGSDPSCPDIMHKGLFIWMIVCFPGILYSQNNSDSISIQKREKDTILNKSEKTVFPIMFNICTVFYSTKDSKIDKFLGKYGYTQPQQIPV